MSSMAKGKAIRETTLGIKVQKTLASLTDANIFEMSGGEILITALYGVVTGVGDGGATTIKLQTQTNTIDLCAATTVTGDTVGEVYFLTGDKAVILNGTGNVPVKNVGSFLSAFPYAPIIIDATTADAIQLVQTGDDATHAVRWSVFYIPLTEGAVITAS